MLQRIRRELKRVHAEAIIVQLDEAFEPAAGALVKVQREDSYWHLLPEHFVDLLRQLPDGAGADRVHRAIEQLGTAVWHGPAPKNSRDSVL